jgi:Cytochrome c
MNLIRLTAILTIGVTTFSVYSCQKNAEVKKPEASAVAAPSQEDLVKKGEYLVKIAGCNDCHSAKRMGANGPEIIPETMLAGYPSALPVPAFDSKMLSTGFAMFTPDLTAAAGPWGISFAANLTPDESGLGNWTLAQFKKALTEGKLKGMDGGRMLLPPMPWVNYVGMKDDDIAAMFAYLQSIKPVKNVVPQPIAPK